MLTSPWRRIMRWPLPAALPLPARRRCPLDGSVDATLAYGCCTYCNRRTRPNRFSITGCMRSAVCIQIRRRPRRYFNSGFGNGELKEPQGSRSSYHGSVSGNVTIGSVAFRTSRLAGVSLAHAPCAQNARKPGRQSSRQRGSTAQGQGRFPCRRSTFLRAPRNR